MDKDTLGRIARFGGRNIAENLKHIPADKWDWKPAPESKSVGEILNHVLGNYAGFNGAFGGMAFSGVTGIAEAQAALVEATESYAANLEALTPERMGETVELGDGPVPLGMVAWMAAIDICNHHGQITYIETLLGDGESHFDPKAFEALQ